MLIGILPLVLLCSGPAVSPQDGGAAEVQHLTVESRITEVTVFSGTASVKRRASLPAGDAQVVVPGLPYGLDPDSVRVRCEGGEVVGVEVRDRVEVAASEERLTSLRRQMRDQQRTLAALQDDRSVLENMEEHVLRLLRVEEQTHATEVQGGRVDPKTWDENFDYLSRKLTSLRKDQREQGWLIEEQEFALRNLQLELGQFESTGGVRVRDIHVDVVDTTGAEGSLEVEYIVGDAGWEPHYDLRAQKDLSSVEFVYRAKVWQRSGEDWTDVDVLLSTAQPQRGAQGPEPRTRWLSLEDPRRPSDTSVGRSLRGLGYAEEEKSPDRAPAPARTAFARVSDEGISLRYRLPRKETIESRDQSSTVLIGRQSLRVDPEHYCVPALDTTVWLRAKAKNTSPWIMLPGRASVYFGADFIGHAQFGTVQLGQELTLHLGADPGLVVKRTKLENLREGSGMFSSRETLNETWRIELENHGGFSSRADGAVLLIVHEALPKSTDDRITVEIDSVTPALQEGERWNKLREEKGVLTWVLRLPRNAKQRLELATQIVYPEDMRLLGR